MLKAPKGRHARLIFDNEADIPSPGTPVIFQTDHLGRVSAYVEGIESGNGGGNGSIVSEMWAPPESADSFDDEFTEDSLDAAWTLYDNDGSTTITPSGTIDPYASFATGGKVETNTYRRSWLSAQVKNTDVYQYLMKAYAPNTNDVMWARIGHTLRPTQQAFDATIALMLMAATSGHPDPNNTIGIWWLPNSVSNYACRMFAEKITGGVGTDVYVAPTYIIDNAYAKGMYLVLQKRSTTYDFWVFDGIGTGLWLGSTTFAPTIAYAGFMFRDATSPGTKPGNAIFSVDFIRLVQNTSVFLP